MSILDEYLLLNPENS